MRKPIPGYRYFECDMCGTEWKTPTRDHTSPSGEHCISCDNPNSVSPWSSEPVALPLDANGNLTIPDTPEEIKCDDPSVIAVLPVGDGFMAAEAKHDIRLGDVLKRNEDGTVSPIVFDTKTVPVSEDFLQDSMRRNVKHFIEKATQETGEFDSATTVDSLKAIVDDYFTSVMGVLTPPLDIKTELDEKTGILSFEVSSKAKQTYSSRKFIEDLKDGLFPEHMKDHPPQISYLEYKLSLSLAKDGFCPIVYLDDKKIKIVLVFNNDLKAVNSWNPGVVGSPAYFKFALALNENLSDTSNGIMRDVIQTNTDALNEAIVVCVNDFSEVYKKQHNAYPKIDIQLSRWQTEIYLT